MLKYLIFICCSLGMLIPSFAQTTANLQGQILDIGIDEGLPFAAVTLEKESVQIMITQTDFDGNYKFSNVNTGIYDLVVVYMGYPSKRITGVLVKLGQVNRLDVEMEEVVALSATGIAVQAYKMPLIEQAVISEGQTLTSDDIKNLSTRSVTAVIGTVAGVNQTDEGENVNSCGGRRSSSNDTYINGVRYIGTFPIPDLDIKEVKVGRKKNKKNSPKRMKKSTKITTSKNPKVNTEEYATFIENEYQSAKKEAFSTFSIDVDRASYANVRRFINQSQKPPKDAVRIEEMVNYFDYNYEQPTDEHPFNVETEMSDCPWNKEAKLVHIGLQGKNVDMKTAAANNLVFLIDVSGSMGFSNKLPLLKESLKLLVENMRQKDKVAIVVYAGAAGLVLPSTSNKKKILAALDKLSAGGSTAGGQGIKLAYKTAKKNFIENGNNRVVLATDGDFNIGDSSDENLEDLIVEKRKDNIFLTVLGYGMGNYKDSKMEVLADKGNGNYAYIDNIKEAKKILVKEMGGTLYVIAKDVKIQIKFNPLYVKSYRLVGYENRLLKKKDFADDKKDAGELGAGHTVTAMYEVILADTLKRIAENKEVKDQSSKTANNTVSTNELMLVRLRYKQPKGEKSILLEQPLLNKSSELAETSDNFRFSAAVAGFGMLLRDSKFKKDLKYQAVLDLAEASKGKDKDGYRKEFITMVRNVNSMASHVK
jgi:Ca-activated chloride channel family protein